MLPSAILALTFLLPALVAAQDGGISGPTSSPQAAGYSCDASKCQLPNCNCASTSPPGGLKPVSTCSFGGTGWEEAGGEEPGLVLSYRPLGGSLLPRLRRCWSPAAIACAILRTRPVVELCPNSVRSGDSRRCVSSLCTYPGLQPQPG
jgi:hypothetical protein